jgi:Zn finger protein HypA/HybF involved in hydrogenase expression
MENHLDIVVVLFFLVLTGVWVIIGKLAFQDIPPLVFRCQVCQSHFLRAAHLRFPHVCSQCGSRDWNRL